MNENQNPKRRNKHFPSATADLQDLSQIIRKRLREAIESGDHASAKIEIDLLEKLQKSMKNCTEPVTRNGLESHKKSRKELFEELERRFLRLSKTSNPS